MGADVVRRARRARVRPVVSDVDPPDPRPRAAPALRGVPAAKGRPVAVIEHPPGEETQWDWVDLPDPPAAWGWGTTASLFVGALAHSGKWRGRAGRVEGSAAPDRRARPDHPRAWAGDAGCGASIGWPRSATRRRGGSRASFAGGRQALRGVGGDLPAAAREPQGCGGEGQPHRRATLVAHPARRRHRRARRRRRWTGSASVSVDTRRRVIDGRPRHRRRPCRTRTAASVPPAPFPAMLTVERTRHRAGVGRLPREPLLGPTRARPHDRRTSSWRLGSAVHRHRHRRRGS